MKKIIFLVFIIILIFGVTGCGANNKATEPIALTKENFEDYFVINAQISNFRQDSESSFLGYIYNAYADLNVKISPKKKITTDNITIKAFVNIIGYGWTSKSFTLTLDVNGNAEYQELMSVRGELISLSPPVIGRYFDDDVKEDWFLTTDKKFIIYELSGNVIEEQ